MLFQVRRDVSCRCTRTCAPTIRPNIRAGLLDLARVTRQRNRHVSLGAIQHRDRNRDNFLEWLYIRTCLVGWPLGSTTFVHRIRNLREFGNISLSILLLRGVLHLGFVDCLSSHAWCCGGLEAIRARSHKGPGPKGKINYNRWAFLLVPLAPSPAVGELDELAIQAQAIDSTGP